MEERPIRSLTLVDGKKRKRGWKSEESRARSTAAGAANLRKWLDARKADSAEQPHKSHGVVAFLQGGKLSVEIANELDGIEQGLIADLGGDPTVAQKTLVTATRAALAVVLLGNAYLARDGLSKLKKNRWLLSTLATYTNSVRLNLLALGLERRAKQVESLDDVIADIASRRATAAQSGPDSPEAQASPENAGEVGK